MKKILILPFLQMPSGHHHAADAISACLEELDDSIEIKKIDIFNYTSRIAEKFSTNLYLKALNLSPSLYSWLYSQNACKVRTKGKRYFLYELLFLNSMKRLIDEEEPDFIFCTHCLPSYLLNCLKMRKQVSMPVVNAYTDYFINTVWGKEHIDFHFAPSDTMKNLLKLHGVQQQKIHVTGIPVHPEITEKKEGVSTLQSDFFNVLVSGGNLGVGQIEKIFNRQSFSGKVRYFVLCGKNQKLFKEIEQLHNPNVLPLSYIPSKQGMNDLYEQMNAILTKPGGVTVSECIRKQIPLFLLKSLPGPEEQNEKYLLDQKLAIKINPNELENQLLHFLENDADLAKQQRNIVNQMDKQENLCSVIKHIIT